MIEAAANKIVEQMEKENLLIYNMKEHYVYAFIVVIEKWITVLTIILISLFFNKFIPSVIFLIFFFSLRKRTGGYHAKKFWECYIQTIATYIVILYTTPMLLQHQNIMYGVLIVSIFLIWSTGTVNHPNIGMDNYELQASKKMVRYILIIESIIIYIFYILDIYHLWISYMSSAVILCAILLCTAKFIRQEV